MSGAMKIHRLVITVLAIATLVAATGHAANAKKVDSNPAGDRIVLDGDPSDWEGLEHIYMKETLRVLAVAHDAEALYVMFRFGDPHLARFISSRGALLWINGDAKANNKNEVYGVRYPGSTQIALKLAADDAEAARETAGEAGSSDGPKISMDLVRQVPGDVTVVRMGETESYPEDNEVGPSAASAVTEGNYCYELRIPFAEMGGKIATANPGKKRQLAIGVILGGLTKEEQKALQKDIQEQMKDQQGSTSSRSRSTYNDPRRFRDRTDSMSGMSGMERDRSANQSAAYAARNQAAIEQATRWLLITLPPV
jgi:hypothetical protein